MANRNRTNPVQFYLSDDEQIYVSSYACAPETAAIDFKYTLDHCREKSPNKAYHRKRQIKQCIEK